MFLPLFFLHPNALLRCHGFEAYTNLDCTRRLPISYSPPRLGIVPAEYLKTPQLLSLKVLVLPFVRYRVYSARGLLMELVNMRDVFALM